MYEEFNLIMSAFLLISGVYFTYITRFVQFCDARGIFRSMLGRGVRQHSGVTPFEALSTALAGSVGTGNIAGVASALAIGGPGALFWMWISALLGMATKYLEVVLAVRYRTVNKRAERVGGAMYCIKYGMDKRFGFMAVLFCIFGMGAALGAGNMVQVNTIAAAVSEATGVSAPMVDITVGAIVAVAVAVITFGGLNRITHATAMLVPFMSILYIVATLAVIIPNISVLPEMFMLIMRSAFGTLRPAAGGIAGFTFIQTLKCGVIRGVFTHEAGMGSSPIAHASAECTAKAQGMLGIVEVFVDTMVLCTLTGFMILCSGVPIPYGNMDADGMNIAGAALATAFSGFARPFLAVSIMLFAFTAILGWSFYGVRCAEFLLPDKWVWVYRAVFILCLIIGAPMRVSAVWRVGETLDSLMALPNIIMMMVLGPKVCAAVGARGKLCYNNRV
ncbi:MAG: amino acid carrier protein [Clostridia bacterium]